MMGCNYLWWRGRWTPLPATALVQSLVATAVLASFAARPLRGAEFAPLPGFETPAPPPKPTEGQLKVIPGLGQLQGIVIVPGKEGAKTPQELLSNIKPEGVP